MSPVDRTMIENRFKFLHEAIEKLERIKGFSQKEFLEDPFLSDAAVRNLVLGVEVITDIGNHILAEAFQASVASYKDILLELGKRDVVPRSFAEENAKMADFRNLLVHVYEGVKLEEVYLHLQKAPDVFRQFARHFVEFLKDCQRV